MTYIITRQPSTPQGTFGAFTDAEGKQMCVTGELPWDNNDPDTSCIPAGTYICIPHNSPAHPNTWEITDVPNRYGILLHNGNAPEQDSLGCVLVGASFGTVNGLPAVLNSVATLEMLRGRLPDTFTLIIK